MATHSNTTPQSFDLQVPGFSSLEARPLADGSISFNGTTKIGGATYFAMLSVTRREDGSPRIKLGDYRFETFTGKAVRGAANVQLEDLMVAAKDAALAWATQYLGSAQPA